MAIKAVVFDIGGVLEITPSLGWVEKWETKLNLEPGDLGERLKDVWEGGSLGTITEADVHQKISEIIGMSAQQVDDMMQDLWTEYLGALNTEIYEYCRKLRPQYRTAILSNSFVGAREKEEEAYKFSEIVEMLIYSHEVGLAKPDPKIYELTCERLGLRPEEVLFIDDHESLIEAARACGLHGVVYHHNEQVIADIEACLKST